MVRVKSNIELVYNSRKQASGIIVIDIAQWQYDIAGGRYLAVVSDYVAVEVEVEVEGVTETIEQLTLISSKDVVYTKEQIDMLFYMLNNPIDITESYSGEMDDLISKALLYTTQTDPVYGSVAENWEIV